jgi:lipoprotein-releasing system permease protein
VKQITGFLCLRYMARRRLMLLSVTAVALSCALLIVVASLFEGFIAALERSATEHLGDIVLSAPREAVISDYTVFLDALEETAAVESATAVLKNQGLLLMGQGNVRLAKGVWGIELPRRQRVTDLKSSLLMQKEAPEITFEPGEDVEIGAFVGIGVLTPPDEATDEYDMEKVKSFLGKRMALTTGSLVMPPEGEAGDRATPEFKRRVMRFACTDVVFTGIWSLDSENVFVPIEALSELLYGGAGGPVANIVQIRLAKGADASAAVTVVRGVWENFARDRFPWASRVDIQTSQQLQAAMIAEYRKQMGILLLVFGIVSLSVVLLVFCIFSLLVMTKRKDIAILKSCGAGSGEVAGLFVGFGFLNGLIGSIFGIGIGTVIIRHINTIEYWISRVFGLKIWKASNYMFSRIPDEVYWPAAAWIVLAAIAAAMIGTLIPAVRAAMTKPVEILRYE